MERTDLWFSIPLPQMSSSLAGESMMSMFSPTSLGKDAEEMPIVRINNAA
jgi:hypothetical protein